MGIARFAGCHGAPGSLAWKGRPGEDALPGRRIASVWVLGVTVLGLGALSAQARPTTLRTSVSSSEAQGNGLSGGPVSVSASGRYVAFRSAATNLVPGDTNGVTDVFVRDTTLGTTVRADVSTSGVQANAAATNSIMSGNGRYVFFLSNATNLAPMPQICTDTVLF